MTGITTDEVLARVAQLPSLPAVVVDLLERLNDERITAPVLARKIGEDQALAAKALRVANSPFYGMAGRIATIQEAIVALGLGNVRALVMAAAVRGQFALAHLGWFDSSGFWKHTIAVALCARVLARRAGENPEAAFTAGLLHDIGRLVLVTAFQDEYRAVLAAASQRACSLREAEREVLGLDHTVAGAALAARWKFPKATEAAVLGHHAPDAAPARLTDIVHLADLTCHSLDRGDSGADAVASASPGAWSRLGLRDETFQECLAETQVLIRDASLFAAG